MAVPDPAPEPADLEERIYQGLRQSCDSDLRKMAKLLAAKPYPQLLGETEFEVRDLVHDLGATALQTALDERKSDCVPSQGPRARLSARKQPVGLSVSSPASDPTGHRSGRPRGRSPAARARPPSG
jgi:hypothetical protein